MGDNLGKQGCDIEGCINLIPCNLLRNLAFDTWFLLVGSKVCRLIKPSEWYILKCFSFNNRKQGWQHPKIECTTNHPDKQT